MGLENERHEPPSATIRSPAKVDRPGPGPWLGAAGCGLTFVLALAGAIAGGMIGWATSPPKPPPGNDFGGLTEFFSTIYHLAAGIVGGAMLGCVVGAVISLILIRRVKSSRGRGDMTTMKNDVRL